MVTLGRLHDRRQTAIILSTFLGILNELVLLEEVLKGAFLAPHLILQDLHLSLKPHVLLLEGVARLFQLDDLVLELLGELVVVDAVSCCQRPNHLTLILSVHCGAIALTGTNLTFILALGCGGDVLHGVGSVGWMHLGVRWLRVLPVMLRLLIRILPGEATLMRLA